MEVLENAMAIKVGVQLGQPLKKLIHGLASKGSSAHRKRLSQLALGMPMDTSMIRHPLERRFLRLLEQGIQGHPLIPGLTQLIEDLKKQSELDLSQHLAKMPSKLAIPLFLFILPAFFCLILSSLQELVIAFH